MTKASDAGEDLSEGRRLLVVGAEVAVEDGLVRRRCDEPPDP
jgi:hypothetical protein